MNKKLYLKYKLKYLNLKNELKNQHGGYTKPAFNIGDKVRNIYTNDIGTIVDMSILNTSGNLQNLYSIRNDNGVMDTANDNALVLDANNVYNPYPTQPTNQKIINNVDPNYIYPNSTTQTTTTYYTPPPLYNPTYYYDEPIRSTRKSSRKSSRKSTRKSSRK